MFHAHAQSSIYTIFATLNEIEDVRSYIRMYRFFFIRYMHPYTHTHFKNGDEEDDFFL